MNDTILSNKISRRNFANKSILGTAAILCYPAFSSINYASDKLSNKIFKTDTHVHLFDLNHLEYNWLKSAPEINRSFSIHDFQKASKDSNIGDIIFVEGGADPGLGIKEAKWISSLAKSHPRIKGIVASLDITKGLDVSEDLELLTNLKLFKGIRCGFPKNENESDNFINGLNLLVSNNLTFDLLVSPDKFENVSTLVKKYPNNIFILDHMGNPDIKSGEFNIWKKGISMLASYPNVNCKISGIVTKAGEGWNARILMPYVEHVINAFGIKRLVYGGDWPVVLLGSSYLDWSTAFEKLTNDLSENEKRDVYQLNAKRIYNL